AGTMVDSTAYPALEGTPELAVRQILARARVPPDLRLAVAAKGLLDADTWAAVAETLESFKTNIARLLDEQALGADNSPTREANLIFLSAAWRKCRALAEGRDARRARLEEDPHRIPEMGIQEHGQKKINFVALHPDVLLTEFREPHKRFIERLDRDFTIHEVVPPYELGEVRVKSEYIAQRGGLAFSAEQLLKAAREDIPATVVLEDDAINRIHAFYIALEYQGHVKFAFFAGKPETNDITGGPLTFLNELEARRRETPGLQHILLVDRHFRKKVHELLVESRTTFPSYSAAMWEVFHNHWYIWSECRAGGAAGPADGPSKSSPKRQRQRQQQQQQKSERAAAAGAAGGGQTRQPAAGGTRRVPENEWRALQRCGPAKAPKTCKFWNLSGGCKDGGACKFKHVCWLCGAGHKWCDNHYTGAADAARRCPILFLEVFGGQANATHELMHRRVPCLPPVDLEATLGHESTDVSDVTVLDKILQWTRAKKLHLVYPQSLSRKIAEFIWRDFAGVRGRVNLTHVDAMTEDHVYVGRDGTASLLEHTACVEKYRRFLLQQPGLLRQLPTLRGKILVCHCDADVPCHADVLLELLEQGNHSDGQIVQFQVFFGLKTASRKRKVGEPVRWPDSTRRKSGHVAVGAGYQQTLGLVPPIFPVDLEPGEAIRRALAVQHPLDVDVSLTDAEQQCVERLVSGTAGKFQATAHEFWKQRATELKERSLDEIYNVPDPFIRNLFLKNTRARRRDLQLGDFVRLALYRELAAAANVADSSYIDEFAHGLPVIGTARPSGRWPPLDEVVAPAISEAELRERAWELQNKIARRVSRLEEPNASYRGLIGEILRS
ncbi:unnamed protein product, partial [Prorocentrum cordatum]